MTAWSCGSCKPFVVRSQLGGCKTAIESYEITKPFLCDLIYNGAVASQLMLIIFFFLKKPVLLSGLITYRGAQRQFSENIFRKTI